MRVLLAASAVLLLSACTTTPKPTPAPPPAQPPSRPEPVQRSDLTGLTVEDLGQRFGAPSFQVREGSGLKLQWAVPGCILDTYLYPPPSGAGVARVTYVDARRPSGDPTDIAGCILAVDAAG